MTKLRKAIMISAMVITMGAATISSFAAASPAGVTGTPSLDELKAQRLELMKDRMEDSVKAGVMTQAQADAMIERMKENQALCDGTGRMMSRGYGMMGNGRGMMGGGYGSGGQGACPYYQAQ
jgi:hypothetical protein